MMPQVAAPAVLAWATPATSGLGSPHRHSVRTPAGQHAARTAVEIAREGLSTNFAAHRLAQSRALAAHRGRCDREGADNAREDQDPGAAARGPWSIKGVRLDQSGTSSDVRRRVTRTAPAPTRTRTPPPTARPMPSKPVKLS